MPISGVEYVLAYLLEQGPLLPCMGSDAISEPSADGVATDAAGGGREPTDGSGGLAPCYGVASPLLLQLKPDSPTCQQCDIALNE